MGNDVVELDTGPRVPKMYRLMVEYLAEREDLPMTRIYEHGLDLLLASMDCTLAELQDYYGKRADDLYAFFGEAAERGRRARGNGRKRKAA